MVLNFPLLDFRNVCVIRDWCLIVSICGLMTNLYILLDTLVVVVTNGNTLYL